MKHSRSGGLEAGGARWRGPTARARLAQKPHCQRSLARAPELAREMEDWALRVGAWVFAVVPAR